MFRVQTILTGTPGGDGINTVYFGSESVSAQDCVDVMSDFWSAMEPVMHTSQHWAIGGEVVEIDATAGAVVGVASVTGDSGQGTDSNEPLPWASQLLVRLHTSGYHGNRRVMGHIYIPAQTVTANDDGVVSAAVISGVTAAAAAAISDPDGELGVWSRADGNWFAATSVTVWNEFSVLRSRRD